MNFSIRIYILIFIPMCLGILSCSQDHLLSSAENGSITVSLPGGSEMDLVKIAPGTFTMGSSQSELGRFRDEYPQHEVVMSNGFYLGKYEVTQAQWESVMDTQPWEGKPFVQAGENYPALFVSWYDVHDFIHRLNVAEGDSLYRLPTEAEWEYACRAGTNTRWSFGNDEAQLWQYAWYYSESTPLFSGYAQTVGQKESNPWGLYDMHGNVREWVSNWYSGYYYGTCLGTDPIGPDSGTEKVIRGGYWRDEAAYVRSASRLKQAPDERVGLIGFRVLKIVK